MDIQYNIIEKDRNKEKKGQRQLFKYELTKVWDGMATKYNVYRIKKIIIFKSLISRNGDTC